MKHSTLHWLLSRPLARARRRLGLALALGALLAVGAVVPAAVSAQDALPRADYQASQVLAGGAKPLTLGMFNRVADLLQEIVGKPFSAAQREHLRTMYVGYWRSGDEEEVAAFMYMLESSEQFDAMAPEVRASIFEEFRREFLSALKDSAQTDADARWLYAIHEGAKPAGPNVVTPPASPAPAQSALKAPAAGVNYTPPAGWTRKEQSDATIFDTTLKPEPRANHVARLTVFKPEAAPRGIAAYFEAEWRRLVVPAAGAKVGEAVAHYRNRLPGGVDAYFMGRFCELPNQTQQLYVVMYVLDLGDRAQTLVATVMPGWDGVGYPAAVDDNAYSGLAQQLFPLLDSITVPGRSASGPLFGNAEVQGNWIYSDGGYGGSFVNAQTGAGLGAAVRGASSDLKLRADGSYEYGFAFYAINPGTGVNMQPSAERHSGRFEFADDVITWRPNQPVSYDPRRKVVGAGVQQTPQGPRRMLIVVSPVDHSFKNVMWVPLWSRHDSPMVWYVEDLAAR